MTAPVPDTLEQMLSPDWLSAALAPRWPGIKVTAVTLGPVVARLSTNARFTIECAGGVPEGLSPKLCGKGYFTDVGRTFRYVGEAEAMFYRDVAAATGMRTLRSVYADVEPGSRHGVVITEDVVEQGAAFLDARSAYSPEQAAQSLGELARLHAATWENAELASAGWVQSRIDTYFAQRGVADIQGNFDNGIGDGVPAGARHPQRIVDAMHRIAATAPTASPWSLVHGDSHVGNVFLDGTGRPAFVDWQMVQRGPWYLDVGYHLASALDVEDRRAHEQDLVRHYLDELTALGVDAPKPDEAWNGVRRGMVYGFFLWGITLQVDPAITSILLTRLGTATADHDALTAVLSPSA